MAKQKKSLWETPNIPDFQLILRNSKNNKKMNTINKPSWILWIKIKIQLKMLH